MPKTINWKKGMRLSEEIFRHADAHTAAHIGQALALAAAGRFGLFPGLRPFKVSVNISTDFAEVESMECLGLTRGGHLVEVSWDSRFTSNFDTRVPLPKEDSGQPYLLTIAVPDGELRPTNDGCCEPAYRLQLQRADSALPGNALPVARLVHNVSWQVDDIDFVPPCLFVSSHPAFVQLLEQLLNQLAAIERSALAQLDSAGRDVIALLLPHLRTLRITADKQRDTLTPMQLLGLVQQCVGTFVGACQVSHHIALSEAGDWLNYAYAPYSEQNVRQLIIQGLSLCAAIAERIDAFPAAEPAPQPAPPRRPEPKPAPTPPPAKPDSIRILTV